MACGCAIIATDVGETRKLVDNEVGFLVKKDLTEIVEKINYLLDNRRICEQMGKIARQRVMREHTIDNYGDYLLNIYKGVC